ncbi:hypothetical protein AgCh_027774 [Apium graveolens]
MEKLAKKSVDLSCGQLVEFFVQDFAIDDLLRLVSERMTNPLYIQILKTGPFTPMVRVEESIDRDMVIPAYAPKDPSEYTESEKEKVSLDSDLQLILIESLDNVMYNNIVNCDTAKQIWEKIKILCERTEEIRSNQRRILILQYEGFMAKPKERITDVFERFNKLINDLQLHDKYYEAKEVNLKFLLTLPDHLEQKISAIREGRDLSRITLKVLYGILKTYELEMIQRKSLRTGQGHVVDGSGALIINEGLTSNDEPRSQTPVVSTKGKSWDDSDNDEDEKVGNYALMDLKQGESSSSKSQVPTLTTTDLNVSQYKETVEKMSIKMFHIHTSIVAANEEVSRLTKINEKLENEKQEAELLLVELEAVRQENAYMKNKLKYATEIEAVLREKLEKNEVKLKSFKNASELVGQYHEKNKSCANIVIDLNYDALNNKKKNIEIIDEDNEKKNAEATQSSKVEEKLMDNQGSKIHVKETKTEDARKKKKNRNRKIGINKSNNFANVADAPIKKYEKCGSVNHLTHLCKKAVSKPVEGACKYNEADANDPYSFCDKFDCIP